VVNLRSWDDRWLPAAAEVVQSRLRRWRGRLADLAGPGTVVGDGVRRQPALAGSIATVTAAAIVLGIAGGPGGPSDGDSGGAPVPSSSVPVPVTTTIGPTPGASVATYLTNASFNLRRFGESARGRAGYAVVDLRRYLLPAQAETLFGGVEVVRAYVRAPGKGLPTQVHAVPLQNTFAPLAAGMQASGRLAAATAHTFGELVAQLKPHTRQDRLLRARYALQQRASAYEAGQLAAPASCACVFSVVVHATSTDLLRLASASEVRAVDPASADVSLNTLTVFPLEPEITGIVPRGGLFGG
jgi:hypothetical protein